MEVALLQRLTGRSGELEQPSGADAFSQNGARMLRHVKS